MSTCRAEIDPSLGVEGGRIEAYRFGAVSYAAHIDRHVVHAPPRMPKDM